ncbi:MAG: hypothetical protein ACJ8FY_07305 [Gemmataceae bacterium]
MPVIPEQFLFRVAYPCPYVKDIPRTTTDCLLDLPEPARIERFAEGKHFANVYLAWNEIGIGLQLEVMGKDKPVQGEVARPRDSDGITFWLDTRGDRTSHRASRFCHQFHFLAAGGGSDLDEPVFVQSKIHRALQEAPPLSSQDVLLRRSRRKGGYLLEAFLPANGLSGFDPDQNTRLGFYYAVRDQELGDQVLSVGSEFPFWEDPSLWSTLQLVR